MGESEEHNFLKYAGAKWLYFHSMELVATEVSIPVWQRSLKGDGYKCIIDAIGLKVKYDLEGKSGKIDTIKGVEVKVSRSDFKNGFISSGMNYTYLLTPEDLLSKNEVQRSVGLLEWDIKKQEIMVIKRAKRQNIPSQFKRSLKRSILHRRRYMLNNLLIDKIKEMSPPKKLMEKEKWG